MLFPAVIMHQPKSFSAYFKRPNPAGLGGFPTPPLWPAIRHASSPLPRPPVPSPRQAWEEGAGLGPPRPASRASPSPATGPGQAACLPGVLAACLEGR